MTYDCPGIKMQQQGYSACYRAGHACPPFVAERTSDGTHITTSYRCPCCGEHGTTMCTPIEWGEPSPVPESIRAGIVLGAVQ
jgi:hypothetical protein